MKEKKVVAVRKTNVTATLLKLEVGEAVTFPSSTKVSTVRSIISRYHTKVGEKRFESSEKGLINTIKVTRIL